MIVGAFQCRLYDYMGSIFRDRGGSLLAINGVADHVHALARLRQDRSVAGVVRDVKANSSRWVRQSFHDLTSFTWQIGYGAFTVSESQIPRVVAYIANQEAHHRRMSFEEEFVAILRANGIAYDERYLWK